MHECVCVVKQYLFSLPMTSSIVDDSLHVRQYEQKLTITRPPFSACKQRKVFINYEVGEENVCKQIIEFLKIHGPFLLMSIRFKIVYVLFLCCSEQCGWCHSMYFPEVSLLNDLLFFWTVERLVQLLFIKGDYYFTMDRQPILYSIFCSIRLNNLHDWSSHFIISYT